MKRFLSIAAIAALVAGCATTTPRVLKGNFNHFTPDEARQALNAPGKIRWGGEIVRVQPFDDKTCIEILAQPLDENARPDDPSETARHFIACQSGELDPRYYEDGRDVTVIGTVSRIEEHPQSEYQHRYAVVDADVIHLWPDNREFDTYSYCVTCKPPYRLDGRFIPIPPVVIGYPLINRGAPVLINGRPVLTD